MSRLRDKPWVLPASLVVSTPPPARRAKPHARLVPEVEEAIEQIRMEELMQEDIEK